MVTNGDLLRQAADRLDELVQAATEAWGDEPWRSGELGWNSTWGMTYDVHEGSGAWIASAGCEELSNYIAAMHPGVGKTLALWLRMVLDGENTPAGINWRPGGEAHCALSVAREILGEDS